MKVVRHAHRAPEGYVEFGLLCWVDDPDDFMSARNRGFGETALERFVGARHVLASAYEVFCIVYPSVDFFRRYKI